MLSTPVFCRRLVGRQKELRFLVDRRRDLSKTHGGIVLVGGEAGIGKSRLVREFLEATSSARGRTAVAQCRPFGSRPYGPILDLLESFAPEAAAIVPASSRSAQHNALVDGLLQAAERRALIGVIEDYHWADAGTANVLTMLGDSLATRRILLVVTYRIDELHVEHPLYGSLGALMRGRSVQRLELAPLSARETNDLIDDALERHPSALARQARRDIAKTGEGNPFFTEELLRSAVDRESASRSERGLPTSVRAAILQRIEPLDREDRRILTQAAVIGRRFDGDLLARTLDKTLDALLPALQRARRCQLVEETDDPRVFRFRHALTREAIFDDLLVAQRQPLHERIARALEPSADDRSIDALAYHCFYAGNREKALGYGERAGDVALALNEYVGAIASYERTLTLLEPSGQDAARVHEKIGTAYYRSGLMDRAIEHYRPAWDFFKSTNDDAPFVFRLTRNIAGALYNDGRSPEAMAAWAEALPVIVACGDDTVSDIARVSYAAYLVDDGEVDEALVMLSAVSRRHVDENLEVSVPYWQAFCVASGLRGDVKRLREGVDRLCSLPRERSLLGPRNDALGEAGTAALNAGETACARRCFAEALDACIAQKSSEMLLADTLLSNAFERVLSGAYDDARTLCDRAVDLLAETKVSWYRAWCVALLLDAETGNPGALSGSPDTAVLETAFESGKAQVFGPLAAAYAQRFAEHGDVESARRLLRRAVTSATSAKVSIGTFPLAVVAARYCDRSDVPAIRALCTRDVSKGPALTAAGDLVEAIMARRFGEDAGECASRAAKEFAAIGWPRYATLARETAAEVPQAASPPDRFRALLTEREAQVARLVADGLANREVAGSLFVSVKLVEKQLSSIYRKLGIRSRSQLAAKLLSFGGDSSPPG